MLTEQEKQQIMEKTYTRHGKSDEMLVHTMNLMREFRNELISRFGEKEGSEIFADFIRHRTARTWKETADLCMDGKTLKDFVRFFWEPLRGGLDYEETWQGEDAVQFRVTRCATAERMKRLGIADIGYHVVCMADYAVLDEIDPEIRFSRTKTLLAGDDCCNHCYVRVKKDPQETQEGEIQS